MTRLCMDCRAVLGEKCPECGGEQLAVAHRWVSTLRRVMPERIKLYVCRNLRCGFLVRCKRRMEFMPGEGGETHGLCRVCLAKRNTELGVEPVMDFPPMGWGR